MPDSPVSRSLQLAKSQGGIVGRTEHWNSFAGVRQDLFGFVDFLVIWPDEDQLVAVQATSAPNASARRYKIDNNPKAIALFRCGVGIEVWAWGKFGPRGKRKIWERRRSVLTMHGWDIESEKIPEKPQVAYPLPG